MLLRLGRGIGTSSKTAAVAVTPFFIEVEGISGRDLDWVVNMPVLHCEPTQFGEFGNTGLSTKAAVS